MYHNGRWHLFCTIRSKVRTHQIEYLSFERWEEADHAPRHVLRCREGYFCAPQVFFLRPHQKWYLIYQVGEPIRNLALQPAFSTSNDLADSDSWTPAQLILPGAAPMGFGKWIDFWVICDEERAYLFFTSPDGRMWRMWTPLESFPWGFDHCQVALQADVHEASHTYRLLGQDQYLTIIEAQGTGGRRYYKGYLSDRLDGEWQPVADSEDRPFAGTANVRQPDPRWADSISHGELVRATNDETLTVDPKRLQFLIQGVTDELTVRKPYGEIPWRLGLLTPDLRQPVATGIGAPISESRQPPAQS